MNYAWCMPNHQTFKMKPIDQMISRIIGEPDSHYKILDPFANRPSKWGAITNDINPEADTDFHMDALSFLKTFEDSSIDGILFDPPYSLRQVKECYSGFGRGLSHRESKRFYSDLKDEMQRIIKPYGWVLSFGWSSVGMGKSRGFCKDELLVVCHGGVHNDTICLFEVDDTKPIDPCSKCELDYYECQCA